MASLTIGTKLGVVVGPTTLDQSWRLALRQPNTCCEQTCHRRATSDTRTPGTRVSATIRAFSSADQRRRRPGPVRTSTRRNSPFASSLTSNIRIARSPLPQANQALRQRPLNMGFTGPLTVFRGGLGHEYRQDAVRAGHGFPAVEHVGADRRALRRRPRGAGAVLCRTIPGDGVRPTDLSRELARHRSVPLSTDHQALPYGLP